jgi:2-phospho-L-lactate/phosphoenolpyruvate guanylyltransferase
VPVKAFGVAKVRLAPALDAAGRAALARSMATRVVAACGEAGLPVVVACDDDVVSAWASSMGASVAWTPGLGLNGAVQQAFASVAADGFELVVVAHGDLPHAAGLDRVVDGGDGVVTVVPDRHDDGTNVMVVPASASSFTFAYGPGSFGRHVAEAERIGLPVRVLRLPELQWDVDTPDDLPSDVVVR